MTNEQLNEVREWPVVPMILCKSVVICLYYLATFSSLLLNVAVVFSRSSLSDICKSSLTLST